MRYIFALSFCYAFIPLAAQDLEDILDKESSNVTVFAEATFKGTRIINGHSIATRKKGVLEFIISHRFGRINSGAYELFGLDQSYVRFGLEYALTDRLTLAVGRSSFEKNYDGYGKFCLLKQKTGGSSFPVSVTLLESIVKKTVRDYDPANKPDPASRLYYTSQILIARKFNSKFSLQIMPTLVHRNLVDDRTDPHDIFAVGMAARFKLSKRVALTSEYYAQANQLQSHDYHNSLGIGVDIETGGHVFQLHLTNSRSMVEKGFITESDGDFFHGDIHFGFNVTRAFQLK